MRSDAVPSGALRYELKLVCQEAAYPRVRMALRLHASAIGVLHPTRRVQSLYLDTPFGQALEDNLAGLSRREKMRLRWYGDEADRVQGTLERKIRENMLGWKESFRLAEPLAVEGVGRRAFVRALAQALPDAWRSTLRFTPWFRPSAMPAHR